MNLLHDAYLTVREVAEIFRVTHSTIYCWIKGGDIVAVQFGGSWRIPQSQFERGVTLLAPLTMRAPAVYWKARCLEQLGRLDEALPAYQRVIELDPEGFEAGRAKSDIEFLEWKATFLSQRKKEAKPSGVAPK